MSVKIKTKPPIEKEELLSIYQQEGSIWRTSTALINSSIKQIKSADTVLRWINFYKIPKFSDSKRFDHLRDVPLTQEQHEIIIGSMLGDGNIDKSRKRGRLRFCHGESQLEYLKWKINKFQNYIRQDIIKFDQRNSKGKSHRNSIGYSCSTIQHDTFTDYYKLFYIKVKEENIKIVPKNIKTLLTPLSLAIWWLDDGCQNADTRGGVICSDSFSKEENIILIDALYSVFGLETNYQPINNRIGIPSRTIHKLIDIIAPYVEKVPTMAYKVKK